MDENSNKYFTDLEVWKKARELKNEIRKLTDTFPNEEKFRLTDQIIRSSRSVTTNIAEGHGRYTYKDQINFCIMARGSLTETHNHIIEALDSSFIDSQAHDYYFTKIQLVHKLLNGYISFLRKNLK